MAAVIEFQSDTCTTDRISVEDFGKWGIEFLTYSKGSHDGTKVLLTPEDAEALGNWLIARSRGMKGAEA